MVLFQPGQYYHIYHHAIGKENLFLSDENYRYFLRQYSKYLHEVSDTFCYCLMPNHFHFLIRIKELSTLDHIHQSEPRNQTMSRLGESGAPSVHEFVMLRFKHFLNGYAQAYNRMYDRKGGLFLKSLKRKIVAEGDYFLQLVRYIHHNPVHHGFKQKPEDWPYSSFHSILSEKETKLSRAELLDWFGSKKEFILMHQEESPDWFVSDFD